MVSQKSDMRMVLVVVVAMLWSGAWAQSSSCTNVLISMSPCLNYITGNSSTPSSGCCTQLANVVRSQPQCLCQVISGGGSSFGINVNQTQALALPGACNVQTPPTSRCNGGASPRNSPTETTKSPNTVPSETGSKTAPSTESGTESGTSSGSCTKMTIYLLISLLFVASYAATNTVF